MNPGELAGEGTTSTSSTSTDPPPTAEETSSTSSTSTEQCFILPHADLFFFFYICVLLYICVFIFTYNLFILPNDSLFVICSFSTWWFIHSMFTWDLFTRDLCSIRLFSHTVHPFLYVIFVWLVLLTRFLHVICSFRRVVCTWFVYFRWYLHDSFTSQTVFLRTIHLLQVIRLLAHVIFTHDSFISHMIHLFHIRSVYFTHDPFISQAIHLISICDVYTRSVYFTHDSFISHTIRVFHTRFVYFTNDSFISQMIHLFHRRFVSFPCVIFTRDSFIFASIHLFPRMIHYLSEVLFIPDAFIFTWHMTHFSHVISSHESQYCRFFRFSFRTCSPILHVMSKYFHAWWQVSVRYVNKCWTHC